MRIARRIALVALLAGTPAGADSGAVSYGDGRVTAHLQQAELGSVLDELARQTHLDIRGRPTPPAPVTIRLDRVPLEQALERLLAGHSFTFTYGVAGLKGVRLFGGSELAAERTIPPGAPGWTEPAPPEASGSLAASHRPVAIGGRLARALGSEQASFSDIVGVAFQGTDTRVRADALRVAFRILQTEPELYADVVHTVGAFDDRALANWLAKAAGTHASEVAQRAARTAHAGVLRERAAAVERLLQGG